MNSFSSTKFEQFKTTLVVRYKFCVKKDVECIYTKYDWNIYLGAVAIATAHWHVPLWHQRHTTRVIFKLLRLILGSN
jgi:hypothetical protein